MTTWFCAKYDSQQCATYYSLCAGDEEARNRCPEWALVKAVNSSSGNLYTMRKIGEAIQ